MTRTAAIFLLAVGLILDLAVSGHVTGIDLRVTGLILAAIGGVALLYDIITNGR